MRTVLIVDDSSFITEGLASILKKSYRTIVSSGGEMCLQILKKETPDIIILDILMEPMDGWETLLHIRENPATRHIPVIMFSAKKISPFEAETHHPYIDEYITKPVSPRDLLDTVGRVLSRKEMSQKTMQLWRQAGLAAEEIEEYVRLVTNIEVDRGLCANMEQQTITERRDSPLDDIQRSIRIIRERIERNEIIANEIAKKGDSLVSAGGDPESFPLPEQIPPSSGEEIVTPGPAPVPGSVVTVADTIQTTPGLTEEPGSSNEDGVPREYSGSATHESPGIPVFSGVNDVENTPAEEPANDHTSSNLPLSERTEMETEGNGPALPAEPPAGYPIPSDPGVLAAASPPGTQVFESLLEEEPEESRVATGMDPKGREEPENILPAPATRASVREKPAADPVPKQQTSRGPPVQPDLQTSVKKGSVPKSPRPVISPGTERIPQLEKGAKTSVTKKSPPAPGFFARLIQAILGIFSRSGR